jgi:type IV pilus biogenesis protein CpaD/CtpE
MMRISLAVLVVSVSACTNFEPYRRTDVWSPTGSNAGNIAAMVARPSDLIVGRNGQAGDAHEAAVSVDRIWQDKPKPLPDATGAPPAGGGAAAPSGGQN